MVFKKFLCLFLEHDHSYIGITYNQNYIFKCNRCQKRIYITPMKQPVFYCKSCNTHLVLTEILQRYDRTGIYTCPVCKTSFLNVIPELNINNHVKLVFNNQITLNKKQDA